jgi:hypothetical protein
MLHTDVAAVLLHALSCAGAVLLAVLRHLGLINQDHELSTTLQQQQLPMGTEERALRAAAVAATDAVAAAAAAAGGEQAQGIFSARDVSSYLLSVVKEDQETGELRFEGAVLQPHSTMGTIAY